jgi:hypothetical protein
MSHSALECMSSCLGDFVVDSDLSFQLSVSQSAPFQRFSISAFSAFQIAPCSLLPAPASSLQRSSFQRFSFVSGRSGAATLPTESSQHSANAHDLGLPFSISGFSVSEGFPAPSSLLPCLSAFQRFVRHCPAHPPVSHFRVSYSSPCSALAAPRSKTFVLLRNRKVVTAAIRRSRQQNLITRTSQRCTCGAFQKSISNTLAH